MVNKKQKGRGGRVKRFQKGYLIIMAAPLACVIFLVLYTGLSSRTGISQPIFEEVYSSATDLQEGITEIDRAIYVALYESGIREGDIAFQDVQTRHQDGHVWDFVELLVRCRDIHAAHDVQNKISNDLTALGRGVSLRAVKVAEGRIVSHVFVKTFRTHKIILKFEGDFPSFEEARPKIAIIIDDLGYDAEMGNSFLRLDLRLSLSVLPQAPFIDQIAREAIREKCEVMLHLPMEPKAYPSIDPGPGALFLSMDEYEIRKTLDEDLKGIAGVLGVNNHMGSSFTENWDKMSVVLNELKKRGLFYIDSRTTPSSIGLELAGIIGLPAAKRNVFLDHDLAVDAMEIQMERLLSMARHSGTAIGIGHPHKETVELLEKYLFRLKTDFQVVLVSELVS